MSELISITVGALLEKVAKMYPDDQAVKYTDRPFNMTWRQFDDEVNRIAKGFLAIGDPERGTTWRSGRPTCPNGC